MGGTLIGGDRGYNDKECFDMTTEINMDLFAYNKGWSVPLLQVR